MPETPTMYEGHSIDKNFFVKSKMHYFQNFFPKMLTLHFIEIGV